MLKIGEFALKNGVTAKMLRNYDEIGLLKPQCVDLESGYRLYAEQQAGFLNWVLLLKELNFNLAEIKELLCQPIDANTLLLHLKGKRIDISNQLKVQQSKSMQINRLIQIIEKEGFQMDRQIDLMSISGENVLEIMKSIPNMGMYLEKAGDMLAGWNKDTDEYAVFIRADMDHLKHTNDVYGLETGDRAISCLYEMLDAAAGAVFGNYVIARSHGDEFVVFGFGNRDKAAAFASRVFEMNQGLDLEAARLPCRCDCCFGIVLMANPSSQWRRIFDYTYEALNTAKHKGINCYDILEYSGNEQ